MLCVLRSSLLWQFYWEIFHFIELNIHGIFSISGSRNLLILENICTPTRERGRTFVLFAPRASRPAPTSSGTRRPGSTRRRWSRRRVTPWPRSPLPPMLPTLLPPPPWLTSVSSSATGRTTPPRIRTSTPTPGPSPRPTPATPVFRSPGAWPCPQSPVRPRRPGFACPACPTPSPPPQSTSSTRTRRRTPTTTRPRWRPSRVTRVWAPVPTRSRCPGCGRGMTGSSPAWWGCPPSCPPPPSTSRPWTSSGASWTRSRTPSRESRKSLTALVSKMNYSDSNFFMWSLQASVSSLGNYG